MIIIKSTFTRVLVKDLLDNGYMLLLMNVFLPFCIWISDHTKILIQIFNGHIPAIPTDSYIEFQRNKRKIKPKTFDNFESSNIIRFRSRNNSRPVEIPNSRTEQHRKSFFIRTASDWNHLSDNKKIEEFKNAIQQQHD
jgi:hypothetical protein